MSGTSRRLQLAILPETLAIVRLSQTAEIPAWATGGPFFSVTRTSDELSIVVEQSRVPPGEQSQNGWRAIKAIGPFDLSEVGVLASLATPLAAAKISVFVLATFDTDYLLVVANNLANAVAALESAGHTLSRSPSK
jgi:uncharacterized protein